MQRLLTLAGLQLRVGVASAVMSNQIRLGLGPSPESSMVVTWVTSRSDFYALARRAAPATFSVFFATDEQDLATNNAAEAVASSQMYNFSDTVKVPNQTIFLVSGNYSSPVIHHAVLEGLSPLTTYFYQVTVEGGDRSKILNFTTVAARGQLPFPGKPSLTVICGDVGQTAHSRNTINAILEHRGYADLAAVGAVEFGIMVGDMAYADGNSSRWDTWGEMMEPLVSHFPMMFGVGNHEIELDYTPGPTYLNPFTHYRNRFHMPGDYSKEIYAQQPTQIVSENWFWGYNYSMQYENGASFYSYDVGLAHYVMLNTYNSFCHNGPGCPQYEFLVADLEAVDRRVTPWVVVTMHAPLYNSNERHPQDSEAMTIWFRAWVEPLLIKYGVNFVFAGHVHAYERFGHVGADGQLDPTGQSPLYITIGDGGNHELLFDAWDPAMQDISAFRNGQFYGYGTLMVFNTTHAKWEWRPNPMEGSAEDAVWATNYFTGPLSTRSPTYQRVRGL